MQSKKQAAVSRPLVSSPSVYNYNNQVWETLKKTPQVTRSTLKECVTLTYHNLTRMHRQPSCLSWIKRNFVKVSSSYFHGLSTFSSTDFSQSLWELDFYKNILMSLCDHSSIIVGILLSRETMVLKLLPGQSVVELQSLLWLESPMWDRPHRWPLLQV